jgi:hypothetical protein
MTREPVCSPLFGIMSRRLKQEKIKSRKKKRKSRNWLINGNIKSWRSHIRDAQNPFVTPGRLGWVRPRTDHYRFQEVWERLSHRISGGRQQTGFDTLRFVPTGNTPAKRLAKPSRGIS